MRTPKTPREARYIERCGCGASLEITTTGSGEFEIDEALITGFNRRHTDCRKPRKTRPGALDGLIRAGGQGAATAAAKDIAGLVKMERAAL